MAVEIRRAGVADVDAVAELRLAFLDDLGHDVASGSFVAAVRSFVEAATADRRWWSWLAEADGAVVGGLSMLVQEVPPHPRDARRLDGFVFNVWVRATHRRQGIGRRLLDACLDEARADGLRRVALVATDDGRSLYESAGFSADPDLLRLRLDP